MDNMNICINPFCPKVTCNDSHFVCAYIYHQTACRHPSVHQIVTRPRCDWVFINSHPALRQAMDMVDYTVYNPITADWDLVSVNEPNGFPPGGFLIYRPWYLRHYLCPDIAVLVRKLHDNIQVASPTLQLTAHMYMRRRLGLSL